MTSRILLRRGTAAQWASANPILGSGELGVETDTLKFKIGNGTSTWTQLTSYANITPSDLTSAINGLINAAPSALDTLNELAAAINNDSSFSTTVNNLLTGKVSKSGGDTITPATTSTTGLTLASPVGQTAHLLYASGGTRIPAGGNYLVTPGLTVSYTSDFNAGAANITPIYVKGAASQTANLQEWQNSAGTLVASMDVSGKLIVPTLRGPAGNVITLGVDGNPYSLSISATQFDSYGPVPWRPYNASMVGFIVKGQASQTADLQQWQNSAGDTLGFVDSDGKAYFSHSSTNTNLFGVHGNLRLRNRNNTTNNYSSIDAQSASGIISSGILFINSDHTNSYGRIVFGTRSAAGFNSNAFAINSSGGISTTLMSASSVGLIVKAAASQTASLQEWHNSAGNVLAYVDSGGVIRSTIFGSLTTGHTTMRTNYDDNGIGFQVGNFAQKGIVVRGFASQTADLQQWQDSAGTVLTKVRASGQLNVGGAFISNTFGVANLDPAWVATIVRGAASQTADLQQWQNSTGTVLASINSNGRLSVTNIYTPTIQASGGGNGSYLAFTVNSTITATTLTSSVVPLTVKGASSQTANLTEWLDSSGNLLAFMSSNGRMAVDHLNTSVLLNNYIVNNGDNGPYFNMTSTNTLLSNRNTVSNVIFTIKGMSGQTGNLQEWQDSSGTILTRVTSSGVLGTSVGVYSPYYQGHNGVGGAIAFANATAITITPQSASVASLIVKGLASQTANLQEWQNSAGTVLASISSDGTIRGGGSFLVDGTYGITNIRASTLGGSLNVGTGYAAQQGIIVRGAASQTSNLQEWQSSSGEVGMLFNMGNAGNPSTLGFSVSRAWGIKWGAEKILSTDGGSLIVTPYTTDRKVLIVKGVASQTADLQQWQNSSGTVLAKVDASGSLELNGKDIELMNIMGAF